MKALILAAGQGTRLKRLTKLRPKPMLPIADKPLLQHTVEWLKAHGIVDIAINVHHHAEVITQYFGDGSAFGVSISYSYEEKLLGTAGAAKRLSSFLDEDFVVVYGDVFTNLDLTRFIELHCCHSLPGHNLPGHKAPVMTLALYRVPDVTQCGIVETDEAGRVIRFIEKPPSGQVTTDLAFSGVMLCRSAILNEIPEEAVFDFGYDVLPALLANGDAIYAKAIVEDESVIDIGTLQGYLNALQRYHQSIHQKSYHSYE